MFLPIQNCAFKHAVWELVMANIRISYASKSTDKVDDKLWNVPWVTLLHFKLVHRPLPLG